MRLITLCILAALPFYSFAQRSDDRMYFSNYIFLKVSPNTVFDNKGGLVPVSLEYPFSDVWGIQVDVGIPIMTELLWKDETKKIQQDYRVGGSMKWYFGVGKTRRGFLGLEAFYREQKAHWGAGAYGMSDQYSFSSADAIMQSRVASVIVGFQRKLSRTLVFEGQGGFGVNYRYIQWRNVTDEHYVGYMMGWVIPEDKARGQDIGPFIPLRISLSLLLGSTKRRSW